MDVIFAQVVFAGTAFTCSVRFPPKANSSSQKGLGRRADF
jgi:hypothetical protein